LRRVSRVHRTSGAAAAGQGAEAVARSGRARARQPSRGARVRALRPADRGELAAAVRAVAILAVTRLPARGSDVGGSRTGPSGRDAAAADAVARGRGWPRLL